MENTKSITWLGIAAIITLGLIGSTYLAVTGYNKSKPTYGVITVTGSAKKQIKSDFAVWNGTFSVQEKVLSDSYAAIKGNQTIVRKYLISKGVPENEISFSSITTTINHIKNYQGYDTNEIDSYKLSQNVEIKSNDVEKASILARESTELIDKGIGFQSNPAQYFYTKIADLKIDMLALATKDAATRAEQIAFNSKTKIIGVKSSKMGVFQITPLYSNDVSDYGINDTSSIEKEIMSVINCEFKTR